MSSRLVAVTLDARDPGRLAGFWGALLGREVVADPEAATLPGSDTQVGLRFAPAPERSRPARHLAVGGDRGRNRVHLHLTSTSSADQQDRVAAALALGGRHLDVGQLPEEGHVVLADPEDNELCVIGPDSTFLAGCGLLGEVACEGTREAGLFWAAALDWPLVWDHDQETAVQSPLGGTKIAWGGPPLRPDLAQRQRFDLVTPGPPDTEADRLVRLGATRVAAAGSALVLADPDGNEFRLARG